MKLTSNKLGAAVRAGICVYIASIGVALSADTAKTEQPSREEMRHKLEEAQQRLDQAAREVAELSMTLSDGFVGHRFQIGTGPQRAMLGINMSPRQGERDDGVEIVSVSPSGAAAEAGLKAGDVLTEVNGVALKREGSRSPHDKLLEVMRDVQPEAKVSVSYRREDKAHTASLVAQPLANPMFTMAMPAFPGMPAVPGPLPHVAFFRADGVFGSAELVPITPKLGQYFGTDKGLLVVRAPADSRLQIEEGDVILDIDGRTPSSPSHALRILGSYQDGEKLKLNVLRAKKRRTFDITVPEASPDEGERMRLPPAMHLKMAPQPRLRASPPPGPGETMIVPMREDAA